MRFTNVPLALQRRCAAGGVSNTTTSPRSGSRKRKMKRFARTRSEELARQPSAGAAQCSVGSIEEVGIRYGFTTQAFTARTIPTATARVTTQSIATRAGCGRPAVRRSMGLRIRGISVARRDEDSFRLQVDL